MKTKLILLSLILLSLLNCKNDNDLSEIDYIAQYRRTEIIKHLFSNDTTLDYVWFSDIDCAYRINDSLILIKNNDFKTIINTNQ